MSTGRSVEGFWGELALALAVMFPCSAPAAEAQDPDHDQSGWPRLVIQTGHGWTVLGVAFSPDGHTVVTGAMDRTARLWNAKTGREIRRFEGHRGFITSVAFAPDGRTILTGSDDKTARLWDA